MMLYKATVGILAFLCALVVLIYVLSSRLAQRDNDEYDKKGIHCPWDFVEYIQSPYEKMWVEHAYEWRDSPCKRYHLDNNSHIASIWYNYTAAIMNAPPVAPPDPNIFSAFVYKRTCTGEKKKIPIEPLALLLRNPLVCANFAIDLWEVIDKNYMYIDWEISLQRKDTNGRTFLFDLGASLYDTGAGGPSQAWFVDNLEKRGLKLNGIYAWEYIVHDAKTVFALLPQRLWPIYHWYNIPVTDKLGSMANPWELMLRVVTKDDLVIVKIDIDTPPLEIALVQQVIANRSISELIDVMYYEDHLNAPEMHKYFGNATTNKLDDTMKIFTSLRQLGIRAHPWV